MSDSPRNRDAEADDLLHRLLAAERDAPDVDSAALDGAWEGILERLGAAPPPDGGGDGGNGRGGDDGGGSELNGPRGSGLASPRPASPLKVAVAIVGGAALVSLAALLVFGPPPSGPGGNAEPAIVSPGQSRETTSASSAVTSPPSAASDLTIKSTPEIEPADLEGTDAVETGTAPDLDLDLGEQQVTTGSTGDSEVKPKASNDPRAGDGDGKNPKPVVEKGLAEELALLAKMRAAFEKGALDTTLRYAKEHRTDFPDGQLVEERAAIEVRASCRKGVASATKRRAAFATQWPDSTHLARIAKDCDEASP